VRTEGPRLTEILDNRGEETVSTKSPARRQANLRFPGLGLFVALVAGCGGSSQVNELPEAAKTALIKRKVDVVGRSPKSSSTGQGSAQGRPGGKRP
jgi:hypothetical protein